jgi:hypothetical protein
MPVTNVCRQSRPGSRMRHKPHEVLRGHRDHHGRVKRRRRAGWASSVFAPFSVIVMQQFAAISLLDGPTPRRMNWPSPRQPVPHDEPRLASSPEMVAYCRDLEFRWLRLAEQAQETGGALGHESGLAATLFPLRGQTAT